MMGREALSSRRKTFDCSRAAFIHVCSFVRCKILILNIICASTCAFESIPLCSLSSRLSRAHFKMDYSSSQFECAHFKARGEFLGHVQHSLDQCRLQHYVVCRSILKRLSPEKSAIYAARFHSINPLSATNHTRRREPLMDFFFHSGCRRIFSQSPDLRVELEIEFLTYSEKTESISLSKSACKQFACRITFHISLE